ncbi:alpha-tectorin-like [Pelodytes ibericus]
MEPTTSTRQVKVLEVHNNGLISFGAKNSKYTPEAFPPADGSSFIAPFMADVDIRKTGNVYYRTTTNPSILKRIDNDMEKYVPSSENLPYKSKWSLIATWDKVPQSNSQSNKTNTFQAVLSTDGSRSFCMLNYGTITWGAGVANGGNPSTGLGGVPAQACLGSGDKTQYLNLPGSGTSDIINIGQTSNVGTPGCWVFRVDKLTVPGGCVYEANFLRYNENFWKDDKCENKCVCHTVGEVECFNEPCKGSMVCKPSSWYFTCQM